MTRELSYPIEFRFEWAERFGGVRPLGWVLRSTSRPWIRFHALPESKRYAESDVERGIVLQRAYDLADAVLGEGARCWLVKSVVEEAPEGEFTSFTQHDDNDRTVWRSAAKPVLWRRGGSDDTLLRIADYRAAPTLWMARDNGAVFAPYDGGFDLFPQSAEQVATLRAKHAAWLSTHPSGL